MGLGGALTEEIEFEDGKILNPRFSRYRVPRFRDVPRIDVHLVENRDIPPAGGGETPDHRRGPGHRERRLRRHRGAPPLDAPARRGAAEGLTDVPAAGRPVPERDRVRLEEPPKLRQRSRGRSGFALTALVTLALHRRQPDRLRGGGFRVAPPSAVSGTRAAASPVQHLSEGGCGARRRLDHERLRAPRPHRRDLGARDLPRRHGAWASPRFWDERSPKRKPPSRPTTP